jgi:hypothetical protein
MVSLQPTRSLNRQACGLARRHPAERHYQLNATTQLKLKKIQTRTDSVAIEPYQGSPNYCRLAEKQSTV